MIQRQRDWPERLHAYIETTRFRPFAFGAQDCASWALGAVDAMCSSNLRGAVLPAYSTEEEAAAALAARGWASLQDAVVEVLGVHEINPFRAQRGDVLWCPRLPDMHGRGPGGALGILDVNAFVCPATERLAVLPFFPMIKRGAVVFPVGRVS